MEKKEVKLIEHTKEAAIKVLLHNNHGSFHGLPRTAGWGYPEPYTRDMMICAAGFLISGHPKLLKSLRRVLETAAKNQSENGHIPSLIHDKEDRGASDTTPLFLLAVGLYRKAMDEPQFLDEAVQKALTWMAYQSPSDRVLVAQLPTTDWRDEQWVLGYGLFVNTVVYGYLRLIGMHEQAEQMSALMGRFTVKGERQHRHVHEGLVLRHKPYFAMWSYKVYKSERFDLLGNSLAILFGIASKSRSRDLIKWIETECKQLQKNELLSVDLPPNFFPYIQPEDPDWRPRYQKYNQPGEYHNGGIWPFICGFYIAALVAAGRYRLAEKKLLALTDMIYDAHDEKLEFGFNEWHRAQDGTPQGNDWQSWSAAMYLYAAEAVLRRYTPFFDDIRKKA